MKTKYLILTFLTAGLMLGGCSKESPFGGDDQVQEGQIMKSALDIFASNDNILITKGATRATGYDLNEFNIAFLTEGNTTPVKSFKYGEMPDIVNLPAGTYSVVATYGDNKMAEWENPNFLGKSDSFEVKAMEITSYIEPIECSLENIKVTIEYEANLFSKMSSDSYVEVKIGDNSGLQYGKSERRAGYFRHTDETTLVATFHGTIDDSVVVETKSYSGIQKGCWYKLTFKLHGQSGSGTGGASGSITVDASVNVDDVNGDINIEEDTPLDDGERPGDGGSSDPGQENPPLFTAISPGLVFDTPWNVTASTPVKFMITSNAEGGFEELTCDIISDDLTPEELERVGLASHLDLVNTPGSVDEEGTMASILNGFGFPVNVGGKKEAVFDITSFMPLMVVFGNHRHEFHIHVKDANGVTDKKLILQF